MKVFRGPYRVGTAQYVGIVAAETQAEAARIVGISMYEMRRHWFESSNSYVRGFALKNPGVLMIKNPDNRSQDYIPFMPKEPDR